MATSHERPPQPHDRAAEISALTAPQLAGEVADAYAAFTTGDIGRQDGVLGFAIAAEFLQIADPGQLEQQGHSNLGLLVTELRTRMLQAVSEQMQQGPDHG